ncbi:MAG: hypothetical protein GX213_01215 [Clostridiaceae bacterium]|nr:hypothetical protein [Clostridiaceae bacterium]
MNEIREILLQHFNKYPKMQVQDMIKLIYQNEFAGGHLINNEAESLKRLQAEAESIKNSSFSKDIPLFEDIGNGLVRLYLNNIPELNVDFKTINGFFVNTSNKIRGNVKNFEKKVSVLRKCCEDGMLPFAVREVDMHVKELAARGYPPISHSDEYRRAYNPSYRVVLSEYRTFFQIYQSIDSLLRTKNLVNIAIDGNSGAGKSSLSQLIGRIYDCNIFHMDDFFLAPELKTEERLREPGGNVDYVRFRHEVLNNIRSQEVFTYRKYNCSKGALDEQVEVFPKRLNIIEGCYSMHPYLINDYDLKIFLHIDKEKQKARILKRNGPLMLERFINEWIPLEDKYFNELNIPDKCDLIYKL